MDTIVFDSGVAICKRDPMFEDESDDLLEYPLDSLAAYLNCPVELRPGTTLAHLWDYLERDAEFFGIVFRQAMGNFDIQHYIKQAKRSDRPREDEYPENRIDRLEIYWDISIWEGEISFFPGFHGVGPYRSHPSEELIEDMGWAVEFSPINELLSYPITLEEDFVLRDESDHFKEIWRGKYREWTVYDIYLGILHEITFCGTPNDQLRKNAELDQTMEEVKDAIKNRKDIFTDRENLEELE